LLHRSVHALDGYRKLASTPASVPASSTVLYDHGHLPNRSLGKYSFCRMRKRMLF